MTLLGHALNLLAVGIANEGRNHIQIRGLPRTALPQDVQRAVVQGRLQGVTDSMFSLTSPMLQLYS